MSDVSVVNSVQDEKRTDVAGSPPEVNLANSDLSPSQQQELSQLLTTFGALFITPENPLGTVADLGY